MAKSPTPPELSPSPPPVPTSTTAAAHKDLERNTEILLHLALELGIAVTDAQSVGGTGKEVGVRINSMMSQMRKIRDISLHPGLREVRVPREVLGHVDAVKNPHIFTKEIIERAVNENQYANAMMKSVADYQNILVSLMEKNFPDALRPLPNMENGLNPSIHKEEKDVQMKIEG
ncbi:hypothetical protein BT69DRAFT_1347911 [Atractiella rhizophila]|nr:hypothetical protein BT69DRAFT_1347911 [Atractiella rhizophila]